MTMGDDVTEVAGAGIPTLEDAPKLSGTEGLVLPEAGYSEVSSPVAELVGALVEMARANARLAEVAAARLAIIHLGQEAEPDEV